MRPAALGQPATYAGKVTSDLVARKRQFVIANRKRLDLAGLRHWAPLPQQAIPLFQVGAGCIVLAKVDIHG